MSQLYSVWYYGVLWFLHESQWCGWHLGWCSLCLETQLPGWPSSEYAVHANLVSKPHPFAPILNVIGYFTNKSCCPFSNWLIHKHPTPFPGSSTQLFMLGKGGCCSRLGWCGWVFLAKLVWMSCSGVWWGHSIKNYVQHQTDSFDQCFVWWSRESETEKWECEENFVIMCFVNERGKTHEQIPSPVLSSWSKGLREREKKKCVRGFDTLLTYSQTSYPPEYTNMKRCCFVGSSWTFLKAWRQLYNLAGLRHTERKTA